MARKKKGSGEGRKPKKVSYTVIPLRGESGNRSHEYEILDRIITQHHTDLIEARFVLIYKDGWKRDRDGLLVLGKCRKASDFDKELSDFDFAIILNRQAWNLMDVKRREILLDHELCHAAPDVDEDTGEQKEDERQRKCWRIRKHSIEEFTEIVDRYGPYHRGLNEFVKTAARRAGPSLFDGDAGEPGTEAGAA